MELDAHSRYILFEIKFRQSLRDLEHCLNCSQLSLLQFEIKIKHMDKTVLSIDSIRLAQWLGRIPSSLETSMRENKIIKKIVIIFWQQNSYMVIHSKVAVLSFVKILSSSTLCSWLNSQFSPQQ